MQFKKKCSHLSLFSFFLCILLTTISWSQQCEPFPELCNLDDCGFGDVTLDFKAEGSNFFCEGEEAVVEIDETTSLDFDFFIYYWCDGVVDTLTFADQPATHRYVINPEDRCNRSQDNYFVQVVGYKECDDKVCLLYTSPSPRDQRGSRMPSSA